MKVRNFTITAATLNSAALNDVIEIDVGMSYTWDKDPDCGGDVIKVYQPGEIIIRNLNTTTGAKVGYLTIQGNEYTEYTELKTIVPAPTEIFGFVPLYPYEKAINPNTFRITKILIKVIDSTTADGDIEITGINYRNHI